MNLKVAKTSNIEFVSLPIHISLVWKSLSSELLSKSTVVSVRSQGANSPTGTQESVQKNYVNKQVLNIFL